MKQMASLFLMLFGAGISCVCVPEAFAAVQDQLTQPIAAAPHMAKIAASAAESDSTVITVSYADGESRQFPADQPLVVARDMENALITMPRGSIVQYTSEALKARFIDLRNFDPGVFEYKALRDGFQLRALVDSGRAPTTLIALDGVPFYVQFVFVPADQ